MIKTNYHKFLPILAILFVPLFFKVNLAHAASGSGVPTGSIPQWVTDDINKHCKAPYNWGLVSDTWLSPVGQPSQTNMNVAQGTPSLNLDLNAIYYRCRVNGGSNPVNGLQDVTFISQANNTDIPVPVSFSGSYPSTNLGGKRYNQTVVRQVTYTPSSPFQASQQVTVNLYNRGYYSATNDIDRCSKWNTGDYNGLPNQDNTDPTLGATDCVTGISPLTIYVTINSFTIQGAVYSPTGAGLNNVPITGTNVPGGLKTGSPQKGWFEFNEHLGNWFSINAQDPFSGTNGHKYSGVKITPYIAGKDKPAGTTSCSFNGTDYSGPASDSGYEFQNASSPSSGTAQCNYGLSTNGGYDFHYNKEQYAVIAVAGTVTPSGAFPGATVDFTGSATVSQTLPDDGNDTYKIAITPSIVPPNASDTTFNGSTCSASSTIRLRPEATKTLPCSITIPSASIPGTQYCVTTSVSSYPSYTTVSGNNPTKCVKVLAPPTISATAASHEIGNGSPADISYTVDCNDFIGTLTYSVAVSSTPLSPTMPHSLAANTFNCAAANATYTNTISNTAAFLDGVAPNQYIYSPSITVAAGVPNLPISGTPVILDNYTVPYARFYGGDIMSGGGTGAIIFNVNPPKANAVGSAAEYAAVAKTTISLASAAFRSGSVDSLTAKISASPNIASTRNTSGGTWANDFNTSGYYGDVTSTTTVTAATNATGKVTVVGNDIYINGDITVDTTNLPPPSGSASFNDSQTPSLVFIAARNIYINHSVHRIDASLQAIAGTIYTCADTGNTPATAVASGSNCQIPLTVNGSVGAKTIKFNRSCGTRLKAPSGEDNPSTSALPGLLDRGSVCSTGMAAEVFNLPNYLYFTSSTGNSGSKMQFQSLYSAPPLL